MHNPSIITRSYVMHDPDSTPRSYPSNMATGGNLSDYQVLFGLQKELVDRIDRSGADVEVLITRAVSKGLITLQSLEANATPTSLSAKERAEKFVAKVLESIRGDATGERTALFLQVLDDLSLSSLSDFIRSKLAGTREAHHDPSPPAHRPGPPRQPHGGAYGGQPTLAPADEEDSGIVREGETNNNENSNSGVEVVTMNARHKLAPADTGGAGFKALSNGVVAVQPEHSDNLAVSPEKDPPAIPETQPHTYVPVSSATPLIIGMANTPPLLPAVAQMQQENQQLATNVQCLQKKLSQLKIDKEESEQLLELKDKELEKVKREKDEEIQILKNKIKEKEKSMEELQRQLSHQEQQNEALKEEHRVEIAKLKKQLEETEEKYHKKTLELTNEKHVLELELEKMRTREEQMKCQKAELKAEVAEEKQKNTELRAQQKEKESQEKIDVLERRHKDSLTRNKQLEEELARLRQKYKDDDEPDTS